MIKLLQLEFISYRTDFSLQVAAVLLINKSHIPRVQWHLPFAYGSKSNIVLVGCIR